MLKKNPLLVQRASIMCLTNTHQAGKPGCAIITATTPIKKAALGYINAGFALTNVNGKKPTARGWNQRRNAITSADQLSSLDGNIGLLHAFSDTCCIDVDNFDAATGYFEDNGLDLIQLLTAADAVQIQSGMPNHAKLLYRTRETLQTFKHVIDGAMVVEFRCATNGGDSVMDVLPPSIHPDTAKPYAWIGNWRKLPFLPSLLAEFWGKNTSAETPKQNNPHRRDFSPMGICSAFSQLLTQRVFFDQKITRVTQDEIDHLCRDEQVTRHVLTFLGFNDFNQLFITGRASVHSPFRKDAHKSGGLMIGADSGLPMFHDFAGQFGTHWLQLNSLYASLISGSLKILKPTIVDGRKIGCVTSSVWSLRLLIDGGVIVPGMVDMPDCPAGANKTIQKVHAGIKRLFEVRWSFKGREDEPITLGRKFVGSWCGVSEDQARESMKYLPKHCIHTAGKHGPANIYLPGYKPPKKPKGRNEK